MYILISLRSDLNVILRVLYKLYKTIHKLSHATDHLSVSR